jgi:LmbE family N-acetylglucosaminyl deacetylase
VRILWIGAHPDDEMYVAPWLGLLVTRHAATVHFLVATSGERGSGLLQNTLPTSVAEVREAEMTRAARVFDGEVTFVRLPDGTSNEPEGVLRAWADHVGGLRKLKATFETLIMQQRPDRIVTFDRHHGCTWHADHRAIGALVQALALPIPTTLVTSRPEFFPLRFMNGTFASQALDVRETWHYLLQDLECHQSQFTSGFMRLFRTADDATKIVWLKHIGRWHRWHYGADSLRRRWYRIKSNIRNRIVEDANG